MNFSPTFPEIEEIQRAGVRIVSSGPILAASYYTRDLNMNPRTGSYVTVDAIFPSETFGSDSTYESVTVKANRYWPVRDPVTLAGRITGCGASFDAPFFDVCLFGSDNDIRGYVAGRYQDFTMFAVQGEVRKQFAPRWGGVAFAGVGQVAATFRDMNQENLLPAAGFGVR